MPFILLLYVPLSILESSGTVAHVDFAPVVDSKLTRLLLMRPHDGLFRNKAFDGSTIYSLTKLPEEVRFLYLDFSKFL